MERRTFLQTSVAVAAVSGLTGLGALPTLAMPYEKKRKRVLGHEIACIDEGAGRPVVFLHGNPTSSYLCRNIITYVTDTHRAIAPDLMGMGDSDKPAMTDTYKESAEYLFAFLDELDLEDAILVIHDWGSCLGWHYARTRPERISGICFMEAMAPPFMPIASMEQLGPFTEFLTAIRTPGVGENLILEQNYFLDRFLAHSSPAGPLPANVMAEYNRYYPTPASRQILLDWPREILIAGEPADVHAVVQANSDWLPTTTFPKLLFHVAPGAILPVAQAQELQGMLTNLESIFLGSAGHFLQEEHPDAIGAGLAEWLTRV